MSSLRSSASKGCVKRKVSGMTVPFKSGSKGKKRMLQHHSVSREQLSVAKVREDSVVSESNNDLLLPGENQPPKLQALCSISR